MMATEIVIMIGMIGVGLLLLGIPLWFAARRIKFEKRKTIKNVSMMVFGGYLLEHFATTFSKLVVVTAVAIFMSRAMAENGWVFGAVMLFYVAGMIGAMIPFWAFLFGGEYKKNNKKTKACLKKLKRWWKKK